ncbi:MAG: DUF2271 domain-containing protein [Castellaniella sp.]|uniref:DUF2271 domain-containing protein n=1 Tax=Castellaniella sp. TaxID=1955812 RepID=UPI001228804C|nr:DUF2271 domain-containing protein [Castellaniella sp.]TAN30519.1 MAG: DUF2271 domain-containing protein [Castellaniella sp.]
MKTFSIAALLAATTLAVPALAQGRTVTLSMTLKNYGGDGAYLAVYLTDARGALAGTLWVAGRKAKYYKHLGDWKRLSAGHTAGLDGVTGASVGEGRTLKVTADLADALFDAGYEIHVDAAVEDMRDSPSEIRVPLTTAGAGQSTAGRQFIQSFSYQVK